MKMKNSLLTFGALTVFTLVLTTSCKKSNNSNGNSVTATVGTTNFQSTGTVATYSGNQFEIAGYTIKSGDTTVTDLLFYTPFSLNVPIVSNSSNPLTAISYFDTQGTFGDFGGFQTGTGASFVTITVTAWDSTHKTIAGTFSGTLYVNNSPDSVMTKGQFNVNYLAN